MTAEISYLDLNALCPLSVHFVNRRLIAELGCCVDETNCCGFYNTMLFNFLFCRFKIVSVVLVNLIVVKSNNQRDTTYRVDFHKTKRLNARNTVSVVEVFTMTADNVLFD